MESLGSSSLFGPGVRTPTLLAIALLGETHAAEIARAFGKSRSRVKDAVDSLERDGVVTGWTVGRTRLITLNPRFFAVDELRILLLKLGAQDLELNKRLATLRRRPRRAGKPL